MLCLLFLLPTSRYLSIVIGFCNVIITHWTRLALYSLVDFSSSRFDEYSWLASGRSFSPSFSSTSEAGGSAIQDTSTSVWSFLSSFAISMSLPTWPKPSEPLINRIFFTHFTPRDSSLFAVPESWKWLSAVLIFNLSARSVARTLFLTNSVV